MVAVSIMFPEKLLKEVRRRAILASLDVERQISTSSFIRGLVEKALQENQEGKKEGEK